MQSPAAQRHEAQFLCAWRVGARKIGLEYFKMPKGITIDTIEVKEQLIPDLSKIKHDLSMNRLQTYQAVLLIGMCDLYDPGFSKEQLPRFNVNSMADFFICLDLVGRQIYALMSEHYLGWSEGKYYPASDLICNKCA